MRLDYDSLPDDIKQRYPMVKGKTRLHKAVRRGKSTIVIHADGYKETWRRMGMSWGIVSETIKEKARK